MNLQENHQNKSFFLKGANNTGILLLHGWSSPPEELLLLGKYLNSLGYTVFAPLFRGHGTRPEDLLGVTRQDWIADAKKSLEEMKKHASKIFVGGISMGGNISMLLSEDEAVVGIIAMGASVKFRFHSLAKLALYFMGLTKTYRKKMFPPGVRKKMGKRDAYAYYPVNSAREVAKLADITRKYLPCITKPILIMQSTTDHMVSKKSPQIIFGGVGSKIKEVYWVKDVYHVFAGEREVYEKIREFIEKI
ncbi:MAG: alpha/beta fold hydrolase [Candidatus Moranbacteria bacterium]|nr:alpha/beta fold hydrolase [Candidatus Moranbacteria bacterium]